MTLRNGKRHPPVIVLAFGEETTGTDGTHVGAVRSAVRSARDALHVAFVDPIAFAHQ